MSYVIIHKKDSRHKDDSKQELDPRPVIELIKDSDDIKEDTILMFKREEWRFLYKILVGIRLAIPFLGKKALNPIAIIDEKNKLPDLLNDPKQYIEILLTPGVKIFNTETENDISEMKPISIDDYISKFLPHIKVSSKESSHSIANEWAAYNIKRLLNPELNDVPKSNDLRFLCYQLVSGMKEDQLKNLVSPATTESDEATTESDDKVEYLTTDKNKRILLVDDQDDVWAEVIRNLLTRTKNGNPNERIQLDVWGKDNLDIKINDDKSVEDIKIKIQENGEYIDYRKQILDTYDVVLLDMRLAGSNEQHQNTDRLSGIVMLKHLLDSSEGGNPGQRVIVFTSSNKSWNIKRALQLGAQDVFIKESPLYPLTEAERIANLNNLIYEIQEGFSMSWLKDIWTMAKKIISTCREEKSDFREEDELYNKFYDAQPQQEGDQDKIDKSIANNFEEFYYRIANQVEIAFNLFLNSDKHDQEKMRLAYISLETVFELMSQEWLRLNNLPSNDAHAKTVSVQSRVAELISNYGLVESDYNNGYLNVAIKVLVLIRNNAIHPECVSDDDKKGWYLKDERWRWRLSNNEECQTIDRHNYVTDYVTAFRALMYLLYLIFVKGSDFD